MHRHSSPKNTSVHTPHTHPSCVDVSSHIGSKHPWALQGPFPKAPLPHAMGCIEIQFATTQMQAWNTAIQIWPFSIADHVIISVLADKLEVSIVLGSPRPLGLVSPHLGCPGPGPALSQHWAVGRPQPCFWQPKVGPGWAVQCDLTLTFLKLSYVFNRMLLLVASLPSF